MVGTLHGTCVSLVLNFDFLGIPQYVLIMLCVKISKIHNKVVKQT